jgi:hypothetical protein
MSSLYFPVPWDLYMLSRPRPRSNLVGVLTAEQKAADAALQWRSISYLIIALVTPFFGLHLLRTVLATVGAVAPSASYITYFQSTLFVLTAGIRPFKHLVALLMGHTRTLQGIVHHPPHDAAAQRAEEIDAKIDQLETVISDLATRLRRAEQKNMEENARREQGLITVQDSFDRTAARLEEGARRRERKVEVSIEILERKVEGLEKKLDSVSRMALSSTKEEFLNGNGWNGRSVERGGRVEGAGFSRVLLRLWDRIEWIWVLISGGGLGSPQAICQKPPPPYGPLSPRAGYTFPPRTDRTKKGHHPRHSQALSLGTVSVGRGGSGLPIRRGAGGSVLSSSSGAPSLQTVMEEGAEGEAGEGEFVQSSLILNGNGNLAPQEEEVEEPANTVKHGRYPTIPLDSKSSAFKTVHVPAKYRHPGSPENGTALKVRFDFTKEKPRQVSFLARVIRLLFAPLRLVRWLLVSVLGKIVRM